MTVGQSVFSVAEQGDIKALQAFYLDGADLVQLDVNQREIAIDLAEQGQFAILRWMLPLIPRSALFPGVKALFKTATVFAELCALVLLTLH